MSTLIICKNFKFTQFLFHYFQAVIKDPALIDIVERKSKQRTVNFICILDEKIGNIDYKEMKKGYNESLS